MGRGSKNIKKTVVSPNPTAFRVSPDALKREATTLSQRDYLENTIKYGADNAFPLRLAKAVEDSPATSACIRTISRFIKGAAFSDPDLMKIKVNKTQTLWDLHSVLSKSLALFEGLGLNFKYNFGNKISGVFDMSFESLRFVKPDDDLATEINQIKYNPYYGTVEYQEKYTKTYDIYNPDSVKEQFKRDGTNYKGQVYYYGTTSPLHRFYPFPTYYSAKDWIEADAKFQQFMNQELENGFFQSVILNMIGDPNQASDNPKYQKEVTGEDGVKRLESTKTVGEEFNDQMSKTFSGSKKAGTAMVFWANNKDNSPKVEAFPGEILSDRLTAQQDLTTKNITIATGVMAILANISEGVSLGSGGSEMQKAVEIMQSNTVDFRVLLEQLYNEVILPNLDVEGQEISLEGRKVQIVNYNPISKPVEINEKVWEWMNDQEKADFIKKNMPDITLFRTSMSVQTAIPGTEQQQALPQQAPNEALKNLNIQQITRIQKIVAKYILGLTEPQNTNSLSYEQARVILSGYGLTDIEIQAFLPAPDQQIAS